MHPHAHPGDDEVGVFPDGLNDAFPEGGNDAGVIGVSERRDGDMYFDGCAGCFKVPVEAGAFNEEAVGFVSSLASCPVYFS